TQAIITLASNLGIDVIAEGVETKTQRDLLTQLKCHYAQGFLFSKPLCASDMVAYLQNTSSVID
ncbi:MAG: EAL domain-containing protein, partial [Thermosynechococcaceae cyanobacterium]